MSNSRRFVLTFWVALLFLGLDASLASSRPTAPVNSTCRELLRYLGLQRLLSSSLPSILGQASQLAEDQVWVFPLNTPFLPKRKFLLVGKMGAFLLTRHFDSQKITPLAEYNTFQFFRVEVADGRVFFDRSKEFKIETLPQLTKSVLGRFKGTLYNLTTSSRSE